MRASMVAVVFLTAACSQPPFVIDHSGDAGTPPPRAGSSATYDAANGTIVMFGGADRLGVSSETWTWDGAGWRQHHPTTSPPGREFAWMGFDPATSRVILFGGVTCPPPGVNELLGCDYEKVSTTLADTWTWDGSTWSQLKTKHVPSAPINFADFGGAAGDLGHGKLILVTSGAPDPDFLAQTWVLDNGDWQRLHPKHSPLADIFSGPAYDSVSGRLIVQQSQGPHYDCGANGCAPRPRLSYDTTWSWDGSDWHDLGPTVRSPHSYGRLLSVGRHGLLLIDGNSVDGWNGSSWAASAQMEMPEDISPAMRPRFDWAGAYHEPTRQLVLVGGRDFEGNHLFGNTAGWNGSGWATLVPAPPSPPVPLSECSPTKTVSAEVGGGAVTENGPANIFELDFFEPPAGPCHLKVSVVLSLVSATGSPLRIAGNPSTQPVDADLTWDGGGQTVTFTGMGLCALSPGAVMNIRAGDFQQSMPLASSPCLTSSPATPSISSSVQPSGLRP
jgi:Galactose oxidase, central domain